MNNRFDEIKDKELDSNVPFSFFKSL